MFSAPSRPPGSRIIACYWSRNQSGEIAIQIITITLLPIYCSIFFWSGGRRSTKWSKSKIEIRQKFPADVLCDILALLLQSGPHTSLLGNWGTFLHGLLYRVLATLPHTVLADSTVLQFTARYWEPSGNREHQRDTVSDMMGQFLISKLHCPVLSSVTGEMLTGTKISIDAGQDQD